MYKLDPLKVGSKLEPYHWLSLDWILEEKKNGARYLLYITEERNKLLSRRISRITNDYVDKTANVPHITSGIYKGLTGTVLDGEIMHNTFYKTNSVMVGGSSNAIKFQLKHGFINYYLFDILKYKGDDVRNKPLHERRKLLRRVYKQMVQQLKDKGKYLHLIKQFRGLKPDKEKYFNKIINKGGEGVVFKNINMGYNSRSMIKLVSRPTISAVVSNYNPSEKSGYGTVDVGVFNGKKFIEIGTCKLYEPYNEDKLMGKVVDLQAKDFKRSSSRLIQPALCHCKKSKATRIRINMDAGDCTLDKVIKDLC